MYLKEYTKFLTTGPKNYMVLQHNVVKSAFNLLKIGQLYSHRNGFRTPQNLLMLAHSQVPGAQISNLMKQAVCCVIRVKYGNTKVCTKGKPAHSLLFMDDTHSNSLFCYVTLSL